MSSEDGQSSAPSASRCPADVEAYEMRRRRKILAEYPTLRQQAIADFVLSTASAANDLRKVVTLIQQGVNPSHEAMEAARYIEDIIRCRYRECFGSDLGQ